MFKPLEIVSRLTGSSSARMRAPETSEDPSESSDDGFRSPPMDSYSDSDDDSDDDGNNNNDNSNDKDNDGLLPESTAKSANRSAGETRERTTASHPPAIGSDEEDNHSDDDDNDVDNDVSLEPASMADSGAANAGRSGSPCEAWKPTPRRPAYRMGATHGSKAEAARARAAATTAARATATSKTPSPQRVTAAANNVSPPDDSVGAVRAATKATRTKHPSALTDDSDTEEDDDECDETAFRRTGNELGGAARKTAARRGETTESGASATTAAEKATATKTTPTKTTAAVTDSESSPGATGSVTPTPKTGNEQQQQRQQQQQQQRENESGDGPPDPAKKRPKRLSPPDALREETRFARDCLREAIEGSLRSARALRKETLRAIRDAECRLQKLRRRLGALDAELRTSAERKRVAGRHLAALHKAAEKVLETAAREKETARAREASLKKALKEAASERRTRKEGDSAAPAKKRRKRSARDDDSSDDDNGDDDDDDNQSDSDSDWEGAPTKSRKKARSASKNDHDDEDGDGEEQDSTRPQAGRRIRPQRARSSLWRCANPSCRFENHSSNKECVACDDPKPGCFPDLD